MCAHKNIELTTDFQETAEKKFAYHIAVYSCAMFVRATRNALRVLFYCYVANSNRLGNDPSVDHGKKQTQTLTHFACIVASRT